MAINIYEPYSIPASGEMFRCIANNEDAFVMEWVVQPNGYVAFEHIHIAQDEIFHVRQGEVKIVIGGKEHIGKKGETIIVPKGAAHIAYNNSSEELKCVVEYRPSLDYYKVAQCFAGLVKEKEYDKNGKINIPKMGYFLKKMKCKSMTRPTEIPAFLFDVALNLFYLAGVLFGWEKQYKKYLDD